MTVDHTLGRPGSYAFGRADKKVITNIIDAVNKRCAVMPMLITGFEENMQPLDWNYAIPARPSRRAVQFDGGVPPEGQLRPLTWWLRETIRRISFNPENWESVLLSWAEAGEGMGYPAFYWQAKHCEENDIADVIFNRRGGGLIAQRGAYTKHPTIANRWDRPPVDEFPWRYLLVDGLNWEIRDGENNDLIADGSWASEDRKYDSPLLRKEWRYTDERYGGVAYNERRQRLSRQHSGSVYKEMYEIIKACRCFSIGGIGGMAPEAGLSFVRSRIARSGNASGVTWEDAKAAAVANEETTSIDVADEVNFESNAEGRREWVDGAWIYHARYTVLESLVLGFPDFMRNSPYFEDCKMVGKATRGQNAHFSTQGLLGGWAENTFVELPLVDGQIDAGAGAGPGPSSWPSEPESSSWVGSGIFASEVCAVAEFDFEDD